MRAIDYIEQQLAEEPPAPAGKADKALQFIDRQLKRKPLPQPRPQRQSVDPSAYSPSARVNERIGDEFATGEAVQPEVVQRFFDITAEDVKNGVLHTVAIPFRAVLGAGETFLNALDLATPIPKESATYHTFFAKPREDLKGLRDRLTFVDEPYSDIAFSLAIGGMAGAGMRAYTEASKPIALLARRQGITEGLIHTGVKSGLAAAAGDKIVIDPALVQLEKRLEGSDMDPRTKQVIAATAPLLIGLVSGATLEARIDRIFKNDFWWRQAARKRLTPKEIAEKWRQKEAVDRPLQKLADFEAGKTPPPEFDPDPAPGVITFTPAQEDYLIAMNMAGKKTAADLNEPQSVLLTGGPPGAGKSGAVKALGIDQTKRVKADADEIKVQSGYDDRAGDVHEASSKVNKRLAREALDQGYHLTYDSLLTNYPLAESYIEEILKKGGTASIAYQYIDAETSIVRSKARYIKGESNRDVPIKASIKGHNYSLPTFIQLFKKYKDDPRVSFSLTDNNPDLGTPEFKGGAITVFTHRGGKTLIEDEKRFDELMSTPYHKVVKKGADRYVRKELATVDQVRARDKDIRARIERNLRTVPQKDPGIDPGSGAAQAGQRPDVGDRPPAEAVGPKSAEASAAIFREKLDQIEHDEQIDRIRQAVARLTETSGKSAEQSARDILNESELLYNYIYTKRLTQAADFYRRHPELVDTVKIKETPLTQEEVDGAIYAYKRRHIAKQVNKASIDDLSDADLQRERMVYQHNQEKDFVKLIDEELDMRRSARKAARPTESRVTTLAGAIRKAGGIAPGANRRDLLYRNKAAQEMKLLNPNGSDIETIEAELRGEWLLPNESLADILLDNPDRLRQGRLSDEARTKWQKKQADELEYEYIGDEPPEGDYNYIKAEDLPEDAWVTILGGSSPEGWGVYKIIDKDPFQLQLETQFGEKLVLGPLDDVQVKLDDLDAPTARKYKEHWAITDEYPDEAIFPAQANEPSERNLKGPDAVRASLKNADRRTAYDQSPMGAGAGIKTDENGATYYDPRETILAGERARIDAAQNRPYDIHREVRQNAKVTPQRQFDFEFEPFEKRFQRQAPAPEGDTVSGEPVPIPAAQTVTMATSGRIRGAAKIRNSAEAAGMLENVIGDAAQENLYLLAIGPKDDLLEVHRYSKGGKAQSTAITFEMVGHLLKNKDVKKLYFIHNHPSGSLVPSKEDFGVLTTLRNVLALRGIDVNAVVMSGKQHYDFTNQAAFSQKTPPAGFSKQPRGQKMVDVSERKIKRFASIDQEPSLQSPDEVFKFVKSKTNDEGILFLTPQNRPIGMMPWPKGKSYKDAAIEIIDQANRHNATSMVIISNEKIYTPTTRSETQKIKQNRKDFLDDLLPIVGQNMQVLDVIERNYSHRLDRSSAMPSKLRDQLQWTNKPFSVSSQLSRAYSLRSDSRTLMLHPATITGPAGAVVYGVDWDHYDKTGELRIDPMRAFVGAFGGVALGAGARGVARTLDYAGRKWADVTKKYIVDKMRDFINGRIVGEHVRYAFGMDRSPELMDAIRNAQRLQETAWNEAAAMGQELQRLAPTALEQKRLMQVLQGGVTNDKEIMRKANELHEIFDGYRRRLEDLKIMQYTQFDKLTRRQRAQLRHTIDDPKATPRDQEIARRRLNAYYHTGSAKEYLPYYYEKHEGLSSDKLADLNKEIKRLKKLSRRGNPEGRQDLEALIAELEDVAGKSLKGRADMRASRMKVLANYSHHRLEIPYDVRRRLGLIENAAYSAAKGYGIQKSDIYRAELLQQVADNPEWAMPHYSDMTYPKNFERVQGKQWGKLDGMWLRRDVKTDLSETFDWTSQFVKNWDKAMGLWKYGKVILNPATHARNFYSNMILAYFGDVSPTDVTTYTRAVKALKNGADDPHYKEAKDWGLFNNSFVQSEIMKLRQGVEGLRDGQGLQRFVRKAASLPAEVYQGNEHLFKMAVFIKARNSGLSVDQAARKAEKYIFNYNDIPPFVRHMRRWVSPFFTFTYKALPLAAEMMIRKPWKVMAIGGAMYGMEKAAQDRLGYDPDKAEQQRELMAPWMRSRVFSILPYDERLPRALNPYVQVRMPFQDKWGNDLFLDLAYILPYGTAGEKWGQSNLPLNDLFPNNPLFDMATAIYTNKDAFTGKPIYDDVLDGTAQITAKYLDLVYKSLAPANPLVPGTRNFDKLKTGFQNTFMGRDVRDWADRPIEFQQAVLSTLMGIKLSPANEQKLREFEAATRRKIRKSASKRKGELKRRYLRNEITKKEFKEQLDEINNLERQLMKERPNL